MFQMWVQIGAIQMRMANRDFTKPSFDLCDGIAAFALARLFAMCLMFFNGMG